MKRTIKTLAFTAALLLTIGVGSSFARSGNNGNDNVNAYFHKDFRQAEIMASTTDNAYTRITFKMNAMILTAYYSNQGELLAVTHNITSNQLPISLLLELKRNYGSYWISDLFELSANAETNYYITLENSDKKITLRSSDNGWENFSKTNKE
jgi:hypothetical protein